MVVRHETRREPAAPVEPPAFSEAVHGMRRAAVRPELLVEAAPAPQRIAPFSSALSADVVVDDTDIGTGRIILLHDPAGNDAWGGTFRCVTYARAEIEVEVATDAMVAEVAWTWLTEALDAHDATHHEIAGTVTRVATDAFGQMAEEGGTAQIEIRASWTPGSPDDHPDTVPDLARHVQAWGELLCTAAGLPPLPEGVALLPLRRPATGGQRGEDR
ncbi:DUF3000 domain-containing protein [Nocardioides bruguierae]|uniref:DUF3000 domain-containing protein n=1 Tax=Nocardioides bruguierae TaxID=2945102 RepID=A0A9X2D670_9ACTN|nr:DUF3000 domain-containing protein [Nocardioides bruguierae]MCM0620098.1 DUF3000 domain-containing protein [Nocardioides bruguierae]